MARLAGRVALVTGAGSGIGRAVAERLASEGALVAASDLRGDAALETAAAISAAGGRASGHAVDVTSPPPSRRRSRGSAPTTARSTSSSTAPAGT